MPPGTDHRSPLPHHGSSTTRPITKKRHQPPPPQAPMTAGRPLTTPPPPPLAAQASQPRQHTADHHQLRGPPAAPQTANSLKIRAGAGHLLLGSPHSLHTVVCLWGQVLCHPFHIGYSSVWLVIWGVDRATDSSFQCNCVAVHFVLITTNHSSMSLLLLLLLLGCQQQTLCKIIIKLFKTLPPTGCFAFDQVVTAF